MIVNCIGFFNFYGDKVHYKSPSGIYSFIYTYCRDLMIFTNGRDTGNKINKVSFDAEKAYKIYLKVMKKREEEQIKKAERIKKKGKVTKVLPEKIRNKIRNKIIAERDNLRAEKKKIKILKNEKYKNNIISDMILFLSWNKRRKNDGEQYIINVQEMKMGGRSFSKKDKRFYFDDNGSDIFDLWYNSECARNLTKQNGANFGNVLGRNVLNMKGGV